MKRFATTAGAVLLLSGGMALSACVPPGPIVVTTTADTVADDGETSLREAFAIANRSDSANTIALASGATYDLTACGAGALAHTTASSLTISGNGSTIHQTCPDARIMRSTRTASSLVIDRTTLVGGPNSGVTIDGAGIDVRGSLLLQLSTVTGVDAGPNGTVVEGNTGGPAEIDIDLGGDFGGNHSTITRNTGTAIRLRDGKVASLYAVISENVGDGVRLEGTSSFDFFAGSIADNTGWGIRSTGTGQSSGRLQGIVARNGQGGVSCTGCSSLSTESARILDNGAAAEPGAGGGIVFLAHQDDPAATPRLDIQSSRITGNRARHAGGGVLVGVAPSSPAAPAPHTSFFFTFVADNATLGDGQPGGGLAVTAGTLYISEFTEISDNVAGGDSDGGGVYYHSDSSGGCCFAFSTLESRYLRNRAGGSGGAVHIETPGAMQFYLARFEGNSAGRDGGAAHVVYTGPIPAAGGLTGEFFDNVAGGRGGGAYAEQPGIGGHYRGNRAAEGGGLFVSGLGPATGTKVSGTFEANEASVRGGGVAVERSNQFLLAEATVTGNRAPRGGGVSIEGSPLGAPEPAVLSRSTIVENSAPVGSAVAATGELRTSSSLVALPLGGGANCAVDPADLVPAGWSFVSDTSCGVHPTDTVSSEDPQLGPLAPDVGDNPRLQRTPAWTSPVGGLIPAEVCDAQTPFLRRGAGCEPGLGEIWEAVRIDGTGGDDALTGTDDRDLMRGFDGADVLHALYGDDQLEGGPGADWLLGGPGNDALIGGAGDDVLIAGEGVDTFDGGAGDDLCVPAGAPGPIAC